MPRKETPKRRDPEASRPAVPGYKFARRRRGFCLGNGRLTG